jgi:hypothetical protein
LKRRSFLQLSSVLPSIVTNRLYAAKSAIRSAIRGLPNALPLPLAAKPRRVKLVDVVAGKTVLLGSHDSRNYYVSVDDIGQIPCFASALTTRNALVISAYVDSRNGSALQRAVLSKLRTISPDDYQKLAAAFADEKRMQPDGVFSVALAIPKAKRSSFPADNLIVAVFEKGSHYDGFNWVDPVFEIAAGMGADRLIVPCLGRNWRDKRTVDFGEFFAAFLKDIPAGPRPGSIHFSLYGQWPTFELGDAVGSLNVEWQRALSLPG